MRKILLLYCAESGKKAINTMRQLGCTLPEGVHLFELPCTGRVSEALLLEALEDGFDGIMVIGCHKDNCKYLDGNLRAEKRVARVQKILAEAGITRQVELVFIAPDEGRKLSKKILRFSEKVEREPG